ncbi:MAG: Spy/CpxP family protein refolding chaperone [Nevskia sp.]|nr:Spy/CpxP family protein refolding chaperone [Nevskia sp.]
MKWSGAIRLGLILGSWVLLAHSSPVLADDPKPTASARMQEHGFDWIEHTQYTLSELKSKLNLSPAQVAGWQTWSEGVLTDARRNLEQRKAEQGKEVREPAAPMDLTTPEQMGRGVDRLRTHLKWMQEHLAQLEAAQTRTKVFYDTLDTNQKTIFDLFWHEMSHRMAGHDGMGMGMGMGMDMHRGDGFGHGAMDEEHEGPCCEH